MIDFFREFSPTSIDDLVKETFISNSREGDERIHFTKEEVIERMRILMKYKAKLTWGDFFKEYEKPVTEFFVRRVYYIITNRLREGKGYSSNDDLVFAAEVISILKKAGGDVKSAKKYLEERKKSDRNYPDILKEIDKLDEILDSPERFIRANNKKSSSSSSSSSKAKSTNSSKSSTSSVSDRDFILNVILWGLLVIVFIFEKVRKQKKK